jgi:replicative DNA helicase
MADDQRQVQSEEHDKARALLDKIKAEESSAVPSYSALKLDAKRPEKHMCERCLDKYDTYNIKQRSLNDDWEDVYPNCRGSTEALPESIEQYADLAGATVAQVQEDYSLLTINHDPIMWGAAELGIITDGVSYDREGEETVMDRWYQRDMLRCSAQFKVYRCGRRVGKTFSMRWETLHFMVTNEKVKVLLICPYEKQVIAFMKDVDELISTSQTLKGAVKNRSRSKHTIEFNNGSSLESVMTGGDKAGGGSKARGQDADLIVFDEVDYIAPKDIEAAIAILADNPAVKILASSTPTGKREYFYEVCTNLKRKYKEFHYHSHVSPVFTKIADDEVRAASSNAAYSREMLGEFGEEATGVFSQIDLDRALRKYTCEQERKKGPQNGWTYMLGVDWNGRAIGVHITVTGFNPQTRKYKLVDKLVISNEIYTQVKGCQAIVTAFDYWSCSHIYADFGAGEAQSELIRKYAVDHNKKKLANNFKPIPMQGSTEIRNPATGQMEKKNNQQLAIDLLSHHLEESWVEMPAEEDYMGGDVEDMGLVAQMRHFSVEKISQGGKPKYVGTDHTLTAFYLTILAFQLEKSAMGVTKYDNAVVKVEMGDMADGDTVRGVQERHMDENKEKGLGPGMFISRGMNNSGKTVNYGNITAVNKDKTDEVQLSAGITGQVALHKKPNISHGLYRRKSF